MALRPRKGDQVRVITTIGREFEATYVRRFSDGVVLRTSRGLEKWDFCEVKDVVVITPAAQMRLEESA